MLCNAQDKASRKDKSGDMISSQDNVFGYMETGTPSATRLYYTFSYILL